MIKTIKRHSNFPSLKHELKRYFDQTSIIDIINDRGAIVTDFQQLGFILVTKPSRFSQMSSILQKMTTSLHIPQNKPPHMTLP